MEMYTPKVYVAVEDSKGHMLRAFETLVALPRTE